MVKKSIFFLLVSMLLYATPIVAAAAPQGKPDNKAILLMKHTVLTLWKLGITSPPSMNAHELCGTTLRFLIRNQSWDSAELRDNYPERFANIPENYILFFDKALVEQTARNVFNGWIDPAALWPGVFLGAAGYYVDTDILNEGVYVDDDSFLPSYASVDSRQQQADGTVVISGKLRRFKQDESSGEEFLWAAAPFMARFVRENGEWRLVSFIITEEAMG